MVVNRLFNKVFYKNSRYHFMVDIQCSIKRYYTRCFYKNNFI